MSSSTEHARISQPMEEGGLFSTLSMDRLSDGVRSPSDTILSPDGVGSKPGTPKYAKSLKIGAGVWNDIRSRIPYYASDWTDAWNYRVVPATTLIFFAKYGDSPAQRQN